MGEEDMEPPTKPPAASASNNVVNNSSSGSNIQANHPSAIAAMDSLRRIASAARQQQQQQQQQSQSQSQVMGGLGGNSMSGYSSANASTAAGHMGASIATAPQTEDVLAAAQLATMMAQHLPSPGSGAPVVPGGPSNNSSSNGSDRQGPARLTAEERAAMEAEAAVIRAQREWVSESEEGGGGRQGEPSSFSVASFQLQHTRGRMVVHCFEVAVLSPMPTCHVRSEGLLGHTLWCRPSDRHTCSLACCACV
jgi:hypothetical protein